MSVAHTTGQGLAISAAVGGSRPGQSALAESGIDFADLLAARRAMTSSAQGYGQGTDGAPAAGEFAAVALFRSGVTYDPQAVAGSLEGSNADTQVSAGGAKAGFAAEPEQNPDLSARSLEADPFASALGFGTSHAARVSSQSSCGAQALGGSALVTSLAVSLQPAAFNIALVGFSGGESTEEMVRPAATRRATPVSPARPGAIALNLSADAEAASVTARVAGLAEGEMGELDRRIREELEQARFEVRVVRINGRRLPATGRE